jgi:hypothetical protein
VTVINGVDYDLSSYAGRQAARDANPGLIVDATSAYNPTTGQQVAGTTGAQTTVSSGAGSQLAAGINSLLGAIASGNQQAFNEAVRQFNQTFGLDQAKFQEAVRQFNENLNIAQAGVTGIFQGQPTLQAAQMFGAYGVPTAGQPTLAAQQQAYAQGTGTLGLASQLQANPFRQQEVLGALGPLLAGRPVPGFQSPTGSAGNTGLGYLQQLIDDIRSPQANQARMEEVLRAIPTPNQLNSVSFFQSPQSTQNLVLQGIQEKYGLNPQDALQQIRNTLPSFSSPSTFGTIR